MISPWPEYPPAYFNPVLKEKCHHYYNNLLKYESLLATKYLY